MKLASISKLSRSFSELDYVTITYLYSNYQNAVRRF